jgi:hypothetical protein
MPRNPCELAGHGLDTAPKPYRLNKRSQRGTNISKLWLEKVIRSK